MKKTLQFLATLLGMMLVGASSAQDGLPQPGGNAQVGAVPQATPETLRQQASYVIGRNIGNDFRRNEIEIDPQSFLAGVTDAIADQKFKWSEAECEAAMVWFQQEMRRKDAEREKRMAQAGAGNKQLAAKFLNENKAKPGVQTTPSGLQYKVLRQGNGATPTINDTVTCHYKGTLLDGTVFDSSYDRNEPAKFPVAGVIKGWTEALQKMKVGDKWQLFVPAELAYGDDPPGPPIQPGSLLVFEVELLDVNK